MFERHFVRRWLIFLHQLSQFLLLKVVVLRNEVPHNIGVLQLFVKRT